MNQPAPTFEQFAANRLVADRNLITRDWVDTLSAQLDLDPRRVLPHNDLLDHIPVVLARAADFLLVPDQEKLTAEKVVTDEMRDIANLRRGQGFDVQEIIREFDELARLLDAAALRWLDDYPGVPDVKGVGRVFGRLNRVPLLMGQITVGTIEEERTSLLRQLAIAEEEERLRLSRELHDQMGQLVTALLLGLRGLQHESTSAEQSERIVELEKLADRIAREVQQLALDLRPPALDTLGLPAALESLLHEWSARNGVEADLQSIGIAGERFPAEVETMLYRVAQEGLTNVSKHARASRVSLVLERRGENLSIIMEDDGVGFDPEAVLTSPDKARRLGLRGMRERVARLGGTLEIESSPGAGTCLFIRARVPAGEAAPGAGPAR
ncbi:MAG TPA: sensor histidine kinase [Longimicrobium sp.]|jgi:signal transduction histidine kinase